MYSSFFLAAARSPARQSAWRMLIVTHLLLLTGYVWLVYHGSARQLGNLGIVVLVAGIIEGALLLGWRLTQVPRSQSLEFLLASPMRPARIFVSEAMVGTIRLAFATLSGLPIFVWLVLDGILDVRDLWPLLVMPFTWGWVTGLFLTVWAYEPKRWRAIGERLALLLVLVYLVVGVMAGEKLAHWLGIFPAGVQDGVIESVRLFHTYNPFAVMRFALLQDPMLVWNRLVVVEMAAMFLGLILLGRAAIRMQSHFHERHYSPIVDRSRRGRPPIGLRPLTWWAVKRVTEYSGRVNLWLAGGFGVVYAFHIVAGDYWPAWMGRRVFETFDRFFGVAGVTTGLVVLATVPAAFQYGLWDSNTQDRCRRLELLLLTRLDALDYWSAALAAAWKRGHGYFVIAVLLFGAAVAGGRLTLEQVLLAGTAAMLMWLLFFTLGFRAFSTGMQANNLGLALTVALPLVTIILHTAKLSFLAGLTPPGLVYQAATANTPYQTIPGFLLVALLTSWVGRTSLNNCLNELKLWYEKYHGRKIA